MSYLDSLKSKLSGASVPDNLPSERKIEPVSHEKKTATQEPTENIKSNESPKINLVIPKENKQFFLSQTLIKAVTNQHGDYNDVCPRYINEVYIKKTHRVITEPMMHGIFGESLILGGGAQGQFINDLPRHKKTGEKLTAQLNIEEQAQRAKIWCAERCISIIPGINTQLPIIRKMPNGRLFRTELDLFPTPFLDDDGKLKLAVIDLKFTADVTSNWGDYCWGAPQFMDHLQPDSVYWILQDFDMELNIKYNPEKEEIYRMIFENKTHKKAIENEDVIFIYFVIGYKKQPLQEQVRFYHREYRETNGSLIRQTEFMERARKTIAQLNEWHAKGWPTKESDFCDKCPVAIKNGGFCDKGLNVKKI
jgi:hypothetical protein